MKIIITETQAKLLIEGKIKCLKCDHSWVKEKDDEHPDLCHSCGWDSKENKYNKTELKKFWKNYNSINEVRDSGIKVTEEYLKKRIPFLKHLETSVTDERDGDLRIQFQNVTYNQNVEYVNYKTDPPTELKFKQYNTVLELYYYEYKMGGSRNENPRYRYAIGLRFEIPLSFEDGGDELFEHIYRLANKQVTEKLSYNNDVITESPTVPKEFMDESVNQILKRFFEIEEWIENLPMDIKNPLAGYIKEMKFLKNKIGVLSENSFERTKEMIAKSVDRIGIVDTIKKFGLSVKAADKFIEPSVILPGDHQLSLERIKSFSTYQCREILQYYIFNKKSLPSYYKDDEVKIHLSFDSFVGTWNFSIYFDENENEAMTGYATMFWDDNKELPISIDFYINHQEAYESEFEFNDYMTIDQKFKTVQQLVDFYNENYFSAIKYYTKKALHFARKEMYEWFEDNRSDSDI